jgi:phosphatidate cytidylyltransferase
MADVSIVPKLSKTQIFFRRFGSTAALWTVVIAAMFSRSVLISNGVFLLLLVVIALAGLVEFYGLVKKCGLACFNGCGLVGGFLLLLGTFLNVTGHLGTANGLCLRQFLSKSNATGIVGISTTLFGLMYVPWLLNFIQKINFFPGLNGDGKFYVFYFILVTKFSDTGAYVIGSLIGKHKMIPRISPGKTWEGFGGAILVATGASLAFVYFFRAHMPGMNWIHAMIVGVILSCTAVIGDLIESLFKREAGVKDSGKFFPGIGGILDLLDSLLFNAPLMYLYLRHVLTNP